MPICWSISTVSVDSPDTRSMRLQRCMMVSILVLTVSYSSTQDCARGSVTVLEVWGWLIKKSNRSEGINCVRMLFHFCVERLQEIDMNGVQMMTDQKSADYRAAIIGCGSIANSHASGYNRTEATALVACADTVEAKAQSFAERNGIPNYYVDYRHMLEVEKPDIVSVCTWHPFMRK